MAQEKITRGRPKNNSIKEGGLLKKWMGTFKDDKGIFQGGMKGRMFGRAKDRAEERFGGTKEYKESVKPTKDDEFYQGHKKKLKVKKKDQREYSEDIRESKSLTEKAGYDMYARNKEVNPNFKARTHTDKRGIEYEVPAYSEEFSYAREFALDFDPSDKESVKEMQRRLNMAGYKDANGKALDEDGVLGNLTLGALQNMQKDMVYENQYARDLHRDHRKKNANVNAINNMQRWMKRDQELLERKYSSPKYTHTPKFDPTHGEGPQGPPTAPDAGDDSLDETAPTKPVKGKWTYDPITQKWSGTHKTETPLVPMPTEPVVPMPGTHGTEPIMGPPPKVSGLGYRKSSKTKDEGPVENVRTKIKEDKYRNYI